MDKKKTEIGMPSSYFAPEVKVIPIMTQRSILTVSEGDGTFGSPEIPTGPGV